jgi:hypothetical protein
VMCSASASGGHEEQGRPDLENNQIEPDHRVKNDPQSMASGEDKQIAKAVEVMLRSLDRTPAREGGGK